MEDKKAVRRCITASAVVIDKGRVLLIKHKKLGVWIPPGGHVEQNEFPSEAAIREVREETGLEIKLIGKQNVEFSFEDAHTEVLPFAIVYEEVPYATGMHIHFDNIYLAKVVNGTPLLNKNESTDIGWFSEQEIKSLNTFPNIEASMISALHEAKRIADDA